GQPPSILRRTNMCMYIFSATTHTAAPLLDETQTPKHEQGSSHGCKQQIESITDGIVQNTASICNPSKCPESIAQATAGLYPKPPVWRWRRGGRDGMNLS